jgi:tetrahydromethanopterin S-methyltransferase subunit D
MYPGGAATVIPISSDSSGSVGGLFYSLNSDVVYDILTPVHLVIFVNVSAIFMVVNFYVSYYLCSQNWDPPTRMTVYPHEVDGLNVL